MKEASKKSRKKSRSDYLNLSADLLCKAAYDLCLGSFGKRKRKDEIPDAKSLKETCSAVKEAIAIAAGLEKEGGDADSLRVYLCGETEEYSG